MPVKNFDYELKLEKGSILKPIYIEFYKEKAKKSQNEKSLKYFSDVLIPLSFYNMNNSFSKSNVVELGNLSEVWRHLEPHFEMYARSRKRVVALSEQVDTQYGPLVEKFEKNFNGAISEIWSKNKINLTELSELIPVIDYLEDQMRKPLLYNFSLTFSPEFQQRLLFLYSFLWNIRSLVAIDHNSYIEDASHEAIKMDSITDYLPKSEYVVNDALLYHQFKKLFVPFISGRSSDVKIQKLLFDPLLKYFHKYSHNACHLIDHLPNQFISSLNRKELEDALYLVQMDWLLGSEAGMLFKIREEIFALQEGYEKIFWPEYDFKGHQHSVTLHVSSELPSRLFHKQSA